MAKSKSNVVGFTLEVKPFWMLMPVPEGSKCTECGLPLLPTAYHLVIQTTEQAPLQVELRGTKMIVCDICSDKITA